MLACTDEDFEKRVKTIVERRQRFESGVLSEHVYNSEMGDDEDSPVKGTIPDDDESEVELTMFDDGESETESNMLDDSDSDPEL